MERKRGLPGFFSADTQRLVWDAYGWSGGVREWPAVAGPTVCIPYESLRGGGEKAGRPRFRSMLTMRAKRRELAQATGDRKVLHPVAAQKVPDNRPLEAQTHDVKL